MASVTVSTKPMLSVQSLSKAYGGVTAVTNVSFELDAGKVLGLVGPNGAGKTTLVDCIVGTQPASSGRVLINGESLPVGQAKRARAGLGRTFQHPQLALELTPVENIVAGLVGKSIGSFWASFTALFKGIKGSPRTLLAQASDLATEYGVTTAKVPTADLSLGAQRLVEIARAMAMKPRVLLLDEPFAGADPEGIDAIGRAIRQVRDAGRSVILVDHNVDLVSDLSNEMVLLSDGKLVFHGTPQKCMASQEMQDVYFGDLSQTGADDAQS